MKEFYNGKYKACTYFCKIDYLHQVQCNNILKVYLQSILFWYNLNLKINFHCELPTISVFRMLLRFFFHYNVRSSSVKKLI